MEKNFTIKGETLELLKALGFETGRKKDEEVLQDALRAYLWIVLQYKQGWEVISKERHSFRVFDFERNRTQKSDETIT